MENAGSPLGHEQVNGFGAGYPPSKKACVEDALGGLNGVKNGTVMPPSPIETKHSTSNDSIVPNGNHRTAGAVHNGAAITDSGVSCGTESDFRLKEMKQEPVEDILPCILPTGCTNGSSSSLFPDLNLNDQDWTEIMEEFNRSVPYEDIQELFSDGFGDRKDPEVPSTGAAQDLIPPDLASVKSEFLSASATSAFDQDTSLPLVRSTSSGPSLHTNSPITALPTSPGLPVPQHPQQPSIQPTRSLQNHLLLGPHKDLSPAQQLQQLAAREHHRVHILQSQQQQHVVQKTQQQQATKFIQQPNHSSSWPQNTQNQSQLGGAFQLEKPNSPSLYPQDFPNPKTLLIQGQHPNNGSSKPGTSAGCMQSGGHSNILSHSAAPTAPLRHPPNPGGQAAMLDYSNTKPLSHYKAGVPGAPKGPPTNQKKTNQAILNLMRHQQLLKQRPTGINFRPVHIQHPLVSPPFLYITCMCWQVRALW